MNVISEGPLHRNNSHVSQTCTWTSRLSDLDSVVRGQRSRSLSSIIIFFFIIVTGVGANYDNLCWLERLPLLPLCVKEAIFQSLVLLCSNMDF